MTTTQAVQFFSLYQADFKESGQRKFRTSPEKFKKKKKDRCRCCSCGRQVPARMAAHVF